MTNLTLNYSNIKSINQSVRIIKKYYIVVSNLMRIFMLRENLTELLKICLLKYTEYRNSAIHNEQIILGYILKKIKESHSRNIQACKLSVIQGSLERTRKRNELITVNLNILPSFPRPRNPPVPASLQASPLCFRFLYLLANNKIKYINLSICH